jgi:membrane protein insertase Oxa1/YidC/SpoIIIJ
MFYYMPAGLNLYWLATNVFGIGESILIRRQIERDKERKAAQGPQTPRPKGFVGRLLEKWAAEFEELQKKADEVSQTGGGNKGPALPKNYGKVKDKKKGPGRF